MQLCCRPAILIVTENVRRCEFEPWHSCHAGCLVTGRIRARNWRARMAPRLDLVDYHVHTARCGHASGQMAAYVERAVRAGLPEMGFSDHIFLYWLAPDQRDPELAMSEAEFDVYVEDVVR